MRYVVISLLLAQGRGAGNVTDAKDYAILVVR